MRTKPFVLLCVLASAACDEPSAPADPGGTNVAGKASAATSHATAGEEVKTMGATKKRDRPREEARKPPLAEPAKGQPGKVLSPFSGKPVDVSGKEPGELVQDPAFPGDETKRFQVPEGVEKPVQIPAAKPVPGKAGFVFSPYNNKIIDVTGMPPGMMVADPTYPATEKKHFRVPEPAPPAEEAADGEEPGD